jgi:hypothetical protein
MCCVCCCCCAKKKELPKSQFANGRMRGGPRNQNYDSMRTFTTSLTVSSRHSTCMSVRPNRVVILEKPKHFLPTQEEVRNSFQNYVCNCCVKFPSLFHYSITWLSSSCFHFDLERKMTINKPSHHAKLNIFMQQRKKYTASECESMAKIGRGEWSKMRIKVFWTIEKKNSSRNYEIGHTRNVFIPDMKISSLSHDRFLLHILLIIYIVS